MTSSTPSSRLEELERAECLELLARRRVGRVAVVVDGQPQIFPVNYAVVDDTVVFRTAPGTKLDGASWARVAFEVDDIDEERGAGWDVVVLGRGDEITDSMDARSEQLRQADVRPMAAGAKDHWVRVSPTTISGRRLVPG